nr:phage head-tail connector protein [uncultured Rhodopila sp.]
MLTVTTPVAATALCTLDAVKAELKITTTDNDTEISGLIAAASTAISNYCGRTSFGLETVLQTERLTTTRNRIILARDLLPVITSITLDGTALVFNTDYEIDGQLLYRLSGVSRVQWCGSVLTIAYTAGYALPGGAPADLSRAAVITVAGWYSARGRDPYLKTQEQPGLGTQTYWVGNLPGADGALPKQATDLLDNAMLVTL